MKRSILNRRWLGMGLASLVAAGASVAFGQTGIPYTTGIPTSWTRAILWTYDTGTSSYGGDGYPAGGLTSFTTTWSSADQSPKYNPSSFGYTGGVLGSGVLGPTAISGSAVATWTRGHPGGYNGTGWFNQWNQSPGLYNAFVFDYNAPTTEPLQSNGQLPTMTLWLQFGVGGNATVGNANNNGGTVPYQFTITADGNWHTAIIPSSLIQISDGSGNYTESTFNDMNLYWLHDLSLGMSGTMSANTTVSVELDNIGFAWVNSLPEPSSLALFGLGTLALGAVASYRRKLQK